MLEVGLHAHYVVFDEQVASILKVKILGGIPCFGEISAPVLFDDDVLTTAVGAQGVE